MICADGARDAARAAGRPRGGGGDPRASRSRPREARAALPAEVPLADATFNVAHAALLALGLAQADLALIARGLDDRLHQPRRASISIRARWSWCERAQELGALGATISGAGPTVLFWVFFEQTGALVERLREEVGGWAEVRRLNFVAHGRGRGRAL